MKTGTKIVIAVGALAAVGAVLFGTPYSKGLIKNYWGVGTGPQQAASGTSGTLRAPPANTGRAVPLTDAQRDEMRSMGIAWRE